MGPFLFFIALKRANKNQHFFSRFYCHPIFSSLLSDRCLNSKILHILLPWKGDKPMEIKDFKDYCIANIPNEDISNISELEKTICSKTNKDIVLIAYQTISEAEK
jgi:hypothetical protein